MTIVQSHQKSFGLRLVILIAIVLLSALIWLHFTYPRFSHIDLSITRDQALKIASDYVATVNQIDINTYKRAIIFDVDDSTDRFLQKALGFDSAETFRRQNDYELFFWSVRFFKEGEKEEFKVILSSSTGEVLSYNHLIDDHIARSEISLEDAELKAKEFLIRQFQWNPDLWEFNTKTDMKFDHRVEYTFVWERKNIYIPWDPEAVLGGGKLLSTVVVSGDEIVAFSKQYFSIPNQFSRYVDRIKESGRNLSLISNIGSILFIIGAIWIIVLRRNHITMNATRTFYTRVIIVLFCLSVISALNNSQAYLFSYPTTQPFIPYLSRQAIYEILERFFFFVCFIIPCLAGELLRFEVYPKKSKLSMFHYITTTLLSRDIARTILLGFCFAIIMIALQSLIFEFGYQFCDVWVERGRLSRFSSAYFPFIGVLILALSASISEETFYRLFGFNFAKKLVRNILLAILIPSVIWGFGHTGYAVFPYWFRGLEVTILGIFISLVYLRYGLVCVVVLHFVFDAFWASAPYIFGISPNFDFWMSCFVLSLPLIWAIVSYFFNRPGHCKKVEWKLNIQQTYNLEILKIYVRNQAVQPSFNADQLRSELLNHGWDIAIVDVAFQQLNITLRGDHTLSEP